ncbi:hypothetical protein LLE87_38655, partial [Paenibacillus polymyxa]|nr:hypothetical protein [Paenibacillus polymyxa]
LMGALTSHSVMATLEKDSIAYDLRKDFVPAGVVGFVPLVAVVNPKLPIKSLADLVAYAKANPTPSYGTPGTGTSMHLAG